MAISSQYGCRERGPHGNTRGGNVNQFCNHSVLKLTQLKVHVTISVSVFQHLAVDLCCILASMLVCKVSYWSRVVCASASSAARGLDFCQEM